jgi:hypothetical protein
MSWWLVGGQGLVRLMLRYSVIFICGCIDSGMTRYASLDGIWVKVFDYGVIYWGSR